MITLRIRQWMVMGMLGISVLPWLLYQLVDRAAEHLFPQFGAGLATLSSGIAIILTPLTIGFHMGRNVVRPLEAMSDAAKRIAKGDLDFDLPESKAKEIADVRNAFAVMGAGLQASTLKQAHLEEERRFFIGAIAHDLRTPLFALRGYLDGLELGIADSPDKVAHYLTVCRQKTIELDRLVSDLLDYTKTESLEQTLRPEPLEFCRIVDRAVEGVQPFAAAKSINITLDGSTKQAQPVLGDAHLLQRALENLLNNAVLYTPQGGQVWIRWHLEMDRLTFTVADTGQGIAAVDLPHLFEPFYRGDVSRNRETGGTGLGLTIAKRVLAAHGGGLIAANGACRGAEFTGWIPAIKGATLPMDGQDRNDTI